MKQSVTNKPIRVKVARGIARLNVGGPARQACFLHDQLRQNFDTVLIAGRLDEGEGDMSYLLKNQKGVYWLGSMSRPVKLWSDLVSLVQFVKLLRCERPALLHTHTAKAGALGRAAAMLAGTPIRVHTYHGHVFSGYFSPLKTKVFIYIERFLNRHTHRIIAISESQAFELTEKYRVVPREKVSIIRTGNDLSKYGTSAAALPPFSAKRALLGIPADAVLVVWAGRMVPVKDVKRLAEVIRQSSCFQNIHYLVVGDGPDRPWLEASLKGLRNITFAGWQTEMSEIWKTADIALGTSINEGTPAAFIEAMAAGKPFVSTNVGGVIDLAVSPEALGDGLLQGENCLLTSTSASQIVRCLAQLAADPVRRSAMGAVGRKFVFDHYDRDRMAEDISQLYSQLLGPAAAP